VAAALEPARPWRIAVLVAAALLAAAVLLVHDPIGQNPRYHDLADARTLLGVANFANVATNLPFIVVGLLGLRLCRRANVRGAAPAWAVCFAGVALVCFGSGYYHLTPNDATLAWDRLPITVAFMGLFVALLAEHIDAALARYLLAPAVALGIASVVAWRYTGDLRLYVWVQGTPLLASPLVLALFPPRYTHRAYLLYGFGFSAAAKIAELYDREIYAFTSATLSGHSIKHLLAAAGVFCIYLMLRRRQRMIGVPHAATPAF
jgi:hypothetical protein